MIQATRFSDEVFSLFLAQNSSTIEEATQSVHKICLVQGYIRGLLVYRRYHIVCESAIIIQKNYRRKRAVRETARLFDAVMYLHRKELFDHHARIIQATFRGFYTRKYVLNINQRRRYIASVAAMSANVAEEAREFSKQCILDKSAEDNQRKMAYIKSLSHKHYLRSTKSIPGVYKPHFPVPPQTIDGRPIDEILKAEGLAEAKRATQSVTRSRTSKFPLIGSTISSQKNIGSSVPTPLSSIAQNSL